MSSSSSSNVVTGSSSSSSSGNAVTGIGSAIVESKKENKSKSSSSSSFRISESWTTHLYPFSVLESVLQKIIRRGQLIQEPSAVGPFWFVMAELIKGHGQRSFHQFLIKHLISIFLEDIGHEGHECLPFLLDWQKQWKKPGKQFPTFSSENEERFKHFFISCLLLLRAHPCRWGATGVSYVQYMTRDHAFLDHILMNNSSTFVTVHDLWENASSAWSSQDIHKSVIWALFLFESLQSTQTWKSKSKQSKVNALRYLLDQILKAFEPVSEPLRYYLSLVATCICDLNFRIGEQRMALVHYVVSCIEYKNASLSDFHFLSSYEWTILLGQWSKKYDREWKQTWKILQSTRALDDGCRPYSFLSFDPNMNLALGLWNFPSNLCQALQTVPHPAFQQTSILSIIQSYLPCSNLFLDMHTPLGRGQTLQPSFNARILYEKEADQKTIHAWSSLEREKSIVPPVAYEDIYMLHGGHYAKFWKEGQRVRPGFQKPDPFLPRFESISIQEEQTIAKNAKKMSDRSHSVLRELKQMHSERYKEYVHHLFQQPGWEDLDTFWNLRFQDSKKRKRASEKDGFHQTDITSFLKKGRRH